jgi:hypothetical protein
VEVKIVPFKDIIQQKGESLNPTFHSIAVTGEPPVSEHMILVKVIGIMSEDFQLFEVGLNCAENYAQKLKMLHQFLRVCGSSEWSLAVKRNYWNFLLMIR